MPIEDLRKNGTYSYGIWHISESCDWFLERVELSGREKEHLQTIHNETVRKQWLACRMILSILMPGQDREITYDMHGKPSFVHGAKSLSLSHSGEWAAAIVSDTGIAGIDIEKKGPRILRVAERFMTAEELENVKGEYLQDKLYLHWCAKEAVFKMLGDPGLNLFCDIILTPIDYLCTGSGNCDVWVKGGKWTVPLNANYRTTADYCLVYIIVQEVESPDGE